MMTWGLHGRVKLCFPLLKYPRAAAKGQQEGRNEDVAQDDHRADEGHIMENARLSGRKRARKPSESSCLNAFQCFSMLFNEDLTDFIRFPCSKELPSSFFKAKVELKASKR